MFWLYVFCAIPFVMLGVICLAIVGKVREGRYRKRLLGNAPIEAPKPGMAVVMVMGPFAAIIPTAIATEKIGWLGTAFLVTLALALGFFIRSAAAKRRADDSAARCAPLQ